MQVPQQPNSIDCGAYVMKFIEELICMEDNANLFAKDKKWSRTFVSFNTFHY